MTKYFAIKANYFLSAVIIAFLVTNVIACVSGAIHHYYINDIKPKDTIEAYKEFLSAFPVSEYPDNEDVKLASDRLSVLEMEKTKEQAKEQEKFIKNNEAENESRRKKILAYRPGVTTLKDLLKDGWNFKDPFHGKIGLIGVDTKGNYILGSLLSPPPPTYKRVIDVSNFLYDTMIENVNINIYDSVSYSLPIFCTNICFLKFDDSLLESVSCP